MSTYAGSCLCGKVSFEIAGDFDGFYLCHCSRCRKNSGSAHAANLFSKSAKLQWLKGEAEVNYFNLPSTRHARSFCRNCGSAVPTLQMQGKLLVVPAGSLDGDFVLNPTAHIFYASRARWEDSLKNLPKFDELPG